MNSQSSDQPKNEVKTLFFFSPLPFPCKFCKCNSSGIFTALQFLVLLPLIYTVWPNAYSEVSLEVAAATFRDFLCKRLWRAFTLANQLGWTAQYPTSLSPYRILKKKQKEGSHLLVLYQQAKVALKDRTAAAKVNSQSLQSMYWVVQWSWFARVNALCNLSCKKLWQVSASPPGQFLSRHCFMLCITMKVECKIVKQYKCYHCCSCKNHREKEWRVGKKVPLPRFLADQNTANLWEKKWCFGASYSMSNRLLLVARHILTTGLQKCL